MQYFNSKVQINNYNTTALSARTGQIRLPGTQKNFYMDFKKSAEELTKQFTKSDNTPYLSSSAIPGGLGIVLSTGIIILLGFIYTFWLAFKMPRGNY